VAVAFVLAMSPPLPGSDVMVPHCSPAAAPVGLAQRSHRGLDGVEQPAAVDRRHQSQEAGVPEAVEVGLVEVSAALALLAIGPPVLGDGPDVGDDVGSRGHHCAIIAAR
jgi:hypothetical protein